LKQRTFPLHSPVILTTLFFNKSTENIESVLDWQEPSDG
jgi:hypothetical protein